MQRPQGPPTKDEARVQPGLVENRSTTRPADSAAHGATCLEKTHPCAGCDLVMTRATWGGALLHTAAGSTAPLCPACRVKAGACHLFADLIRRSIDAGATVPGVIAAFKHSGRRKVLLVHLLPSFLSGY